MGRLEALCAANAAEALAYLSKRPYENVFVHWLVASGQAERAGTAVAWRDAGGAIDGFCYLGRQIVPCGDCNAALAAFAERATRSPRASMIAGPRAAVEGLWSHAERSLPRPRAVRASQPLFALERSQLRFSRADADVGRVTRAELEEIVPESAQMIAGEIGLDPQETNADFHARTARIIDAGWWWRYRVDGKLAFMCNIGAASPSTAQLQGVWTPPAMRGQGFATRGLGAICDHLLDKHPTLSLYVNDFNRPAIALYERVGFERVGEFATLLF
jgi:RimJ/RimL family protein N-acetyltransferase